MSTIKLPKTASHGYIYEDGHAVIIHRQYHPKAGDVEWAEVYERIDTHCNFQGRIVFHHASYDALLAMALNAYGVTVREPSVQRGSENTKRLGLRVGELSLSFKDGKSLSFLLIPDAISTGITYQPDIIETFAECVERGYWGCSTKISKIHRVESAEAAAA